MTTRTLELNLRARADTRDLEKLEKETAELAAALRRSSAAFDEATADARKLATAFGQLSKEEREQVQSAARVAAAVSQAAAARERAATAASNAAAAESRSVAAQQAAERAAIQTATANERLAQSQANTASSVSRAASAEEKLAQERQRTFQATSRTEKAELDVARAREQLRAATARAEAAEARIAQTRKSSGLATEIVHKQLQALVTGGLAIAAGRQLLEFGKASIQAASDAEEAAAKFEQVFKAAATGVRKDLETMAEANRRSVYDLISYASTLQDTFVPLGFAREEAAELSKTITQLGIDLAAFSNRADSEVIDNLTSAIVGNHEAVRSYGIVLTETVLKQELARMGALELTGAALEMAKAQARVNIIMRSSADAQGAAVREAESYANTLKAFDAAVLELKVSLGEELLPAMTDLVDKAIVIAKIMNDDYARGVLSAGEANRETASSAVELAAGLKQVVDQIAENGDWAARAKLATSRDIGNFEEVATIFEDIAAQSGSLSEFEEHFRAIGLSVQYLGLEGQAWNITSEEMIRQFYEAAQAAAEYERMLQGVASADLVLLQNAQVGAIEGTAIIFDKAAASIETFGERAVNALERYAVALAGVKNETEAARQAMAEWNQAFGESFSNAPVDDLIAAQLDLRAATGEWRDATVDNTTAISEIQAKLAADLTAEQKAQLQKQLKDIDQFSDQYLAIVQQLEADLSDSERLDLSNQLADLQGRQGETARVYSGDVEAAEEARDAIIAANQAIQDSYYERAYNAIAARLIEEGNFAQLAEIAVGLGLMTQEEAALRLEYAQTTAALDALTASTAFYGLTVEQQVGAVRSLAAGIYDTAAAAIQAQKNIASTADFFSTAPDSTEIGNYYRQLATDAGSDEGITTTVSVSIDPQAEIEFRGFRAELEDYDTTTYKTSVDADSGNAIQDFQDMKSHLDDLTKSTWIIKVKYETEGSAPSTGSGDTGGGGGGGGSDVATTAAAGRGRNTSGAYFDVTVNNYGSGDISGAVKTGVLAAVRSLG